MTEEQLLKGRDLRDAILEAKENVKHLTSDFTDRNPAVKFEINFYDEYRNRITTIESDDEPEIVEKIKQVLNDYYTEKAARLEKEFANL